VDIGTPASAPLTGGGFGQDEATIEDKRTFVWVQGGQARVRLPRAGWRAAVIHVEIRPYEPLPGLRQTVSAALNGKPLGSVALQSGWQDISFNAPGRIWTYGFNVLDLYFSYSLPEPSPSTKVVSAGIDRITIQ